ncbi:putative methyltransferase [Toxoplasma gondii FOU]|uniref:Putative methyltransferase n=3 Tax=Toxoplasma gondii TaxID=5811 RepID=A0A086JKG6_TOXGO|nr:putative methyltransferase [Toxoplasma gondii FOU]PUA84823.1 putative methyltransferase [Toxoplasma gondii TgCATBr9]RQX70176.1 putative methyltransferase [Toxoplasma gondii CAST]
MAMATRKTRRCLPAPSSIIVFLLVLASVAGSCFVVHGFAESSTPCRAHAPDHSRGRKPSAEDEVESLYSTEVENAFSSSPSSLNYTSLDLCPCSAGELLGDPRTDTSWLACSKTHTGSAVFPSAFFDVTVESRTQSCPSRMCMSAVSNSGFFPACEGPSRVRANGTQSATLQVHTGESRVEKKGQKTDVAGMENGVGVTGGCTEQDEKGAPPHAVAHNDNGHPKSKTFSRTSNRERKSASQERRKREASPVLALEWKRFPYDFARGEFEVHGFPLYVEGPSHIRPAHLQQDADTGKSIWDGSVVLARFVSQRLFPAPQTSEASSSIQDAAPRPSKEASSEGPPRRRVVLELGAGLGVAGLAAAAAGTRVAWELGKREREVSACAGCDDACATQKDTAQTDRESDLAGVAVSGGESHVTRAKRNHVILTDLPYCLDTLTENVRRNSHFAVESRPSAKAADAEGCDGSARDAAAKTQLSLNSSEMPVKSQVSVVALDWNEPEKFTEAAKGVVHPGEVEVLLGADIVWLASLVEPLVKTLDWFFKENRKWKLKAGDETSAEDTEVKRSAVTPVVAYIAHQTRSEKTDETLFRALAARGLEVETQHFDDPVANRSPNIRILKIWKND